MISIRDSMHRPTKLSQRILKRLMHLGRGHAQELVSQLDVGGGKSLARARELVNGFGSIKEMGF